MIPEIVSDAANQRFTLELSAAICDKLLLDHEVGAGILLCHARQDELEKFRSVLLDATGKRGNTGSSKMILGINLLVALCLIALNLLLKWPLYICLSLLGLYVCYTIFTHYLFPKRRSLSEQLGILAIHQRITEEFTC